jgi:rubrerythrin
MNEQKSPIDQMLNLALATAMNQYQFYLDISSKVETTKVKELLLSLARSEEALIVKIESMMVSGVLDAVERTRTMEEDEPDDTPFDLVQAETDPRLYVCNRALKMTMKGYTFYLSIAARAKSEVISRVFRYFAHMKAEQIRQIRFICESL